MPAHPAMEQWIGTWGASPAAPTYFIPLEFLPAPTPIQGTVHYRIRVTAGGSRLRLRLSNETGERALPVGGAGIGLADEKEARVQPGTTRRVRFGGREAIAIPAGVAFVSDPVDLPVRHLGEFIVSLYLPEEVVAAQGGDTHKAELSVGKDAVLSESWPGATVLAIRPILSGVTVAPLQPTRTIVTLGDSITDGSTDGAGCKPYSFRGWPDILAERLCERRAAVEGGVAYGVVNAGIGGNRLISSFIGPPALVRLDRDVFAVPGLSHLIVFEGINDIGIGGRTIAGTLHPMVTSDQLIAAYLQIIERSHEQGVKVIGGTLPPFRDAFYFEEEKEAVRLSVNAWIREAGAFDAIVDFDRVIRAPNDPSRLRADFDSGDHLHPNVAAFRAMGQTIDLGLFKT